MPRYRFLLPVDPHHFLEISRGSSGYTRDTATPHPPYTYIHHVYPTPMHTHHHHLPSYEFSRDFILIERQLFEYASSPLHCIKLHTKHLYIVYSVVCNNNSMHMHRRSAQTIRVK